MEREAADENLQSTPRGEYGFLPVDKVLFGPGSASNLRDEVDRLGARRVLLMTTGSVQKTPAADRVRNILGGALAAEYAGVRQHTPSGVVVAAVREAQGAQADMFVSLGGGSVIDATKAAVLALARDIGSFLPHIALPTTLSAAEFSPIFGVTDEETKVKRGGNSPFVTPRVVILDVELTKHTPDWLWLASGARALDHAVETVYAPNHQAATDATSLEAIRLLFTHLEASAGANDSQTARQQCQLASWLSFFGVANVTLGLSHALGREIGPRYNVPHGFTSAVLLPKVMAYLEPATVDRQALIARAAGVDTEGRTETEVALEAAPAVFQLMGRLGLPQRLRDLDIPKGDLEGLASGRQDVLHILQEAW